MEPEKSHEIDAPSANQDAEQDAEREAERAGTADSVAAPPRAPHRERATRALASEAEAGGETAPQVEKSAWLRDDDYWRTVTFMAATGKRPSIRYASRPLPAPDRFRSSSPARSMAVLALVIALMILIPVGVVVAQNVAAAHITIPSTLPGVTLPTATPAIHATLTPTATPKKK